MKKLTRFMSILVAYIVFSAAAGLAVIQSRGGSNYIAWKIDGSNNGEPYGVLKLYHMTDYVYNGVHYNVKSLVDGQLQTMYNNGQRRLRIMIHHLRESYPLPQNGVEFSPNSGVLVSSAGGNLHVQVRQNIQNLLTKARTIGYQEAWISFGPQSFNNPLDPTKGWEGTGWTSVYESYFQENWNVIYNLRPYIVASGISYKIDLLNEGAPNSNQKFYGVSDPRSTRGAIYLVKLWSNYNFRFGKLDTAGFSVSSSGGTGGDIDQRINNVVNLYEATSYGLPYLFDIHVYWYANYTFTTAHNTLAARGFGNNVGGLIIGEAFYCDAYEAQQLRQAIDSTGRLVFFLTQWPLISNGQQVAPPAQFSCYMESGF